MGGTMLVSPIMHSISFIIGAILYAMMLALQMPRKSISRNVGAAQLAPLRRLSLWAAILGLLWSVAGLGAFTLQAVASERVHHVVIHVLEVVALSALGFLPAVVMHSFLQAGMRQGFGAHRRVLLASAYTLSATGAAFKALFIMPGTTMIAVESMNLLGLGFVLLLAVVLLDAVRQKGWDHHAGLVTLAVIAAAVMPFSHHHAGAYVGWLELVGHQAALLLAAIILYQDFRFAFGDIFLKRALSLIGIVGVAMGLYMWVGRPLLASRSGSPSLFREELFLGLWVVTALLYPHLSRGVSWFVDHVVLQRPDYEKFQREVVHEIMRMETPESILEHCCVMLKSVLSTEEIEWASAEPRERTGDGQSPHVLRSWGKPTVIRDAPDVIVEIPTVDSPQYFIRIGPLSHGRRLLSDDLSHLKSLGHLIARRITSVRVTNERCAQALREQKIQKLATDSELRALRAQLHPHFLFNALTTIGYLIQTAPSKAFDTLMRLTDLLRSMLKRLDKEFTTVGHEMDLVQAYLDIERTRFGDRLAVRIDIPEVVRDVPIPALIVQPLVENAVKHGIQRSTSGGRVWITAWIEEAGDGRARHVPSWRMLNLQVSNTGGGAASSHRRNGWGTGLGLSNIKQRLSLYYNERATLDVRSSPEHGTVVNLLIPLDGHGGMHSSARSEDSREGVSVRL